MIKAITTTFLLVLATLTITACSSSGTSPYGDPDAQRERAKDAQGEMRRDTGGRY